MTQHKVNNLMQGMRKIELQKHDYDIENGWTVKKNRNGTSCKQLANFVAWPVREILVDDGADVLRYLDIQGEMEGNRGLPEIRLSHAEFMGDLAKCLSRHWGMDVIIKPRLKDELREAIQALGRTRKKETIYTYTGWRKVNEHWAFLHAGGAVGAENVKVDLSEGGETLSRYALPTSCQDTRQAAETVFSLLEIALPQIAYPLFASVFLAPLCEVLRPFSSLAPDFMVFLIGRTQSGKSSLAALFLSFFGDFDKNHFPANYRQTASSLERTSFVLKDVMMVVDDYFPGQSHKERESMKEMAQKLARAYGDGAVRNRMGANGRLKQSWLPRGLSISTGEEKPDIGESGQARFVFVDVVREDVNYDTVTQIQQCYKHHLAEFMTLYLGWVSVNWDRIPVIFQDTYQHAKGIFTDEAYSGRINESIAKLCGGLEIFLTFAREQGVIDETEYHRRGAIAVEAFHHVLQQNVSSLCAEKPAQKFLAALSEIVITGQGALCPIDAKKIPDHHLGCYDESYIYLFPNACYQAVRNYYHGQGQRFPIGEKTLWKQLKTEGIIECSDARGRNTVQKRLSCLGDNNNVDVLKMYKVYLGLE